MEIPSLQSPWGQSRCNRSARTGPCRWRPLQHTVCMYVVHTSSSVVDGWLFHAFPVTQTFSLCSTDTSTCSLLSERRVWGLSLCRYGAPSTLPAWCLALEAHVKPRPGLSPFLSTPHMAHWLHPVPRGRFYSS